MQCTAINGERLAKCQKRETLAPSVERKTPNSVGGGRRIVPIGNFSSLKGAICYPNQIRDNANHSTRLGDDSCTQIGCQFDTGPSAVARQGQGRWDRSLLPRRLNYAPLGLQRSAMVDDAGKLETELLRLERRGLWMGWGS